MPETIGLAVIGCGGVAQAHLAAVASVPSVRLIATVDVARERAEAAQRRYNAERCYTDAAAACADPAVDAVVVCLPHHLHTAPVVDAADAGKHVLVEKPMALTLADCDAMIAAADRAGTALMVGQVLRHRPANRKAWELIRDGVIGKPVHLIRRRLSDQKEYPSASWSADPAKAGGWLLYGYGAHEYDMCLWLADAQAVRVFARGGRNNPHWQDFDEITALLDLESGCVAVISQSLNAPTGAWDQTVIGTAGSLYVGPEQVSVGGKRIACPLDPSGGMIPQLAEFAGAILGGREPEASGRQVRRTMAALEAAKHSLAIGQPVAVSPS